jgi:hypothetical protein
VESPVGGVVVAGRSASSSARRRVVRAKEVRGGEGKRKKRKGKKKKGKKRNRGERKGEGGCAGGIRGDGHERGVEHAARRARGGCVGGIRSDGRERGVEHAARRAGRRTEKGWRLIFGCQMARRREMFWAIKSSDGRGFRSDPSLMTKKVLKIIFSE